MSRRMLLEDEVVKFKYDFYLKNTEFNGTSDYVDTGLNLFDDGSDWCIYINFTDSGKTISRNQTILHNLLESGGFPGISLTIYNNILSTGGLNAGFGNIANTLITPTISMVIFYRNSKIGYKINKTLVERNYTAPKVNKNLLIGCYQEVGGGKGRYWEGIVNEIMVFKNKTITDDEIDMLLNRQRKGLILCMEN